MEGGKKGGREGRDSDIEWVHRREGARERRREGMKEGWSKEGSRVSEQEREGERAKAGGMKAA